MIDVRDEAAAVFAADAAARLSGLPGVAIVTAGPGLTNTITAVKNAQMAESPVVVMAGATAMILKGRGSLQDIDQLALMKPHVKAQWTITRVRDIVPTVRAALQCAAEGVPGPVFIEYPIEVLWPQELMAAMTGSGPAGGDEAKKKQAAAASAASSNAPHPWSPKAIQQQLMARAQQWYLQHHFDRVFANAFDALPPPAAAALVRIPPPMPPAALAKIRACALALAKSQRPLLLLGSQARRSGWQPIYHSISNSAN